MTPSPLSPLVESELAAALDRVRQQGRTAPSWCALKSSRQTFVRTAERGDNGSVYEYTNDLSVRDRIQIVLGEVPIEVRALIEPDVVAIDADFGQATNLSSVPTPGGPSQGWWWWRIPVVLDDELRVDLIAERVIVGPDE